MAAPQNASVLCQLCMCPEFLSCQLLIITHTYLLDLQHCMRSVALNLHASLHCMACTTSATGNTHGLSRRAGLGRPLEGQSLKQRQLQGNQWLMLSLQTAIAVCRMQTQAVTGNLV